MNWEPFLAAGTILTIALGVGLVCAAVGLTVAVLWRYFSLGFRLAVLRGLAQLRRHVGDTARLYFRRIQWYGHTIASTRTAVACSLVMWFGIAVAFTFPSHWQMSLTVLVTLPAGFLVGAWYVRGPRAINHRFRFACTFFEPAAALAIPSLTGKLIDVGLKSLIAAF